MAMQRCDRGVVRISWRATPACRSITDLTSCVQPEDEWERSQSVAIEKRYGCAGFISKTIDCSYSLTHSAIDSGSVLFTGP
jgi:hypothetical protein